jgi:hypothetical protein
MIILRFAKISSSSGEVVGKGKGAGETAQREDADNVSDYNKSPTKTLRSEIVTVGEEEREEEARIRSWPFEAGNSTMYMCFVPLL